MDPDARARALPDHFLFLDQRAFALFERPERF
jgi:hypothetical protein